ncbi:MAG: DNA polymerase III subunit delta' [[Chlorobium] sp. 445]|nr:MAG: DNA polymerase III subunit delta' [[Chlorobium] sp. 445]
MSWAQIIGQKQQIAVLRRAAQTGRLPNAYLFIGQDGVGKDAIALEFAKMLNCLDPQALQRAEACDQCESCQQFANLTHPNLEYVFPIEGVLVKDISETSKERERQESALAEYKQLFMEKSRNPYFKMQMEKSMGILAEQIEELIRKSHYKPRNDKMRVYLISQAERMNTTAANKLLKVLEEPPPFVLFILTTSRFEQLLPTIVSRCQPVRFPALSATDMAERLRSSGASPAQLAFASSFARGNFYKAQNLLTEPTEQQLRNTALDWLRAILGSGRELDMIRQIEALAKKDASRDEQVRVLSDLLLIFQDAQRYRMVGAETEFINSDIAETIAKFSRAFPNADFDAAAAAVEDALYQLARNANVLLVFTALSIRLKALLNGLSEPV